MNFSGRGHMTLSSELSALRDLIFLRKIHKVIPLECPMSDEYLQRVTDCVSYIGQRVPSRRSRSLSHAENWLPSRRVPPSTQGGAYA